jgi:hypothetical protein
MPAIAFIDLERLEPKAAIPKALLQAALKPLVKKWHEEGLPPQGVEAGIIYICDVTANYV